MGKVLEKYFHLHDNKTDIKTEIIAGITTFMTMAYILALNPGFLSEAGMDWNKVFSATAISSAVACFVMGLYAKLPFGLAPGIGLGAFFTYTVCIGMGHTWRFALTAILFEGIVFLILSAFKVREAIVESIPMSLKKSIGVGIGLFVAFIGLKNGGIVVADETNAVALNPDWMKGVPMLAIVGCLITAFLVAMKVKGALLIGMIVTTVIGIPMGVTTYAGGDFLPGAPYFFEFAFDEITASSSALFDFFLVAFVFLFDDMFNTVGTLVGCAEAADMIREDGTIPNCGRALMADAVGTTFGSMVGTTTVTTYVESSAGISAGGRTGLTAITTGMMFLFSLFLSPVFASIPGAATAPALIIVGVMMIKPITTIDFSSDMTEAIPSFMTIIMMVCTSSIPNGIMFGVFFYVILKVLTGKIRKISPALWVVFVMFILNVAAVYFSK